MSHYYLQVERLDEEGACAFYFAMGSKEEALPRRIGVQLDIYRKQGFLIIHFQKRPNLKHARREDGVRLKILLIEREEPLGLCANADWDFGGDDASVLH